MKRYANTLVREGLEHWPKDEPIAFFCECADEHCHQSVWLAPQDYDRIRDDPNWIPLAHPATSERREARHSQSFLK